MKKLVLASFTLLVLVPALSAHAAPFVLSQEEISLLNQSVAQEPSVEKQCEKLKPREKSSQVGFNATPCFGPPRRVQPNVTTQLAAGYACGKHTGLWSAYCSCQNKKLEHRAGYIGDVYFADCSKDPNSVVDCGRFECVDVKGTSNTEAPITHE
ncbi:MAG: hypothetical protein RL326_44 [Pseudomonadota bacterium]|jgi:hypothetical protein